ncbi:MAG: hypothetical protein KJO66_09155 [Gammaproteobacteria bacterium]|nr:hypothetical protein [Gammaproteobacteria bacterium]NNJ94369.1 hypothetical protein [Halobacteria archaeon]
MIASLRKYAYSISALAVACFFLVPQPYVAVIGALLLQTLAFTVIAGKSTADGIILTGISCLLIGSVSADHPIIREAFFTEIRPWILVTGAIIVVLGLLLVINQSHRQS